MGGRHLKLLTIHYYLKTISDPEITNNAFISHLFFLSLQVVDLPVAIFEAYENFSLCYVALGRRVDAPCVKAAGYRRKKECNFKEARPILTGINEDDSSSQSTSSSSSSSASSNSKDKRDKSGENSASSNSDSDTDTDDDEFQDSYDSVEKEVVVGSLDCRFFKVSYVMINGDAQSQEYHEPLNQFFQDFNCITVVLCGTLKPTAGEEEKKYF